jgi:hypothetical protein
MKGRRGSARRKAKPSVQRLQLELIEGMLLLSTPDEGVILLQQLVKRLGGGRELRDVAPVVVEQAQDALQLTDIGRGREAGHGGHFGSLWFDPIGVIIWPRYSTLSAAKTLLPG